MMRLLDRGGTRTYVEPGLSRSIQEDEDKGGPKGTKHGNEADDEPDDEAEGNQIPQGLHPKKPGEGVALHGLEDVVLSDVEDLRVVAAVLLDGGRDVLRDGPGQRDLTFRSREEERVQDLLGRQPNVLPCHRVRRRVAVRRQVPRRAARVRARPRRPSRRAAAVR